MKFKDFKAELKQNAKFTIANKVDSFSVKNYLPYNRENKTNYFRYAMVSLALLFLVGIGGFLYLSLNPVSFLQIEVNPSIELELNRFNRVIGVNNISQDTSLSDFDSSLKYKNLDDALNLLYEHYESEGLEIENNLYVLYGIDAEIDRRDKISQVILDSKPINVKTIVLAGSFSEVEFGSGTEAAAPMTPDGGFDYNDDIDLVPNIEQGRTYSEIIAEYEISDLRLSLVIMIFNNNEEYSSENDFINLLNMQIYELYELYEKE